MVSYLWTLNGFGIHHRGSLEYTIYTLIVQYGDDKNEKGIYKLKKEIRITEMAHKEWELERETMNKKILYAIAFLICVSYTSSTTIWQGTC